MCIDNAASIECQCATNAIKNNLNPFIAKATTAAIAISCNTTLSFVGSKTFHNKTKNISVLIIGKPLHAGATSNVLLFTQNTVPLAVTGINNEANPVAIFADNNCRLVLRCDSAEAGAPGIAVSENKNTGNQCLKYLPPANAHNKPANMPIALNQNNREKWKYVPKTFRALIRDRNNKPDREQQTAKVGAVFVKRNTPKTKIAHAATGRTQSENCIRDRHSYHVTEARKQSGAKIIAHSASQSLRPFGCSVVDSAGVLVLTIVLGRITRVFLLGVFVCAVCARRASSEQGECRRV